MLQIIQSIVDIIFKSIPFLLGVFIPFIFILLKSKKAERAIQSPFVQFTYNLFAFIGIFIIFPLTLVPWSIEWNIPTREFNAYVGNTILVFIMGVILLLFVFMLIITYIQNTTRVDFWVKNYTNNRKIYLIIIFILNILGVVIFSVFLASVIDQIVRIEDKQIIISENHSEASEAIAQLIIILFVFLPLFLFYFNYFLKEIKTDVISTIKLENGDIYENVVISHKSFSNTIVATPFNDPKVFESLIIPFNKVNSIISVEHRYDADKNVGIWKLSSLSKKLSRTKPDQKIGV
ncbi:hypothetical protein [Jeotgalibacillus aurantiacus]|uniref:hypothetical protein n=1 Tax=Jeotgalibacillus aurantiacus TaxID=2763266 RepID=UPI001D0B5C29|nr:hypothetical protein [Jeotgalibacillus aurantiacus]